MALMSKSIDLSNKIETQTPQLILCPNCLKDIDVRSFKTHQQMFCGNKIVKCPNLGCGVTMQQKKLRKHIELDCVITMKRNKLLQQASKRNQTQEEELEKKRLEEKSIREAHLELIERTDSTEMKSNQEISNISICPQCGEAMKTSAINRHLIETCSFRKIFCPHFGRGCLEPPFPMTDLQAHLITHCKAEKNRDRLIENSKYRLETIMCSACGESVVLCKWRKHTNEDCPNRLVPCRNHHLGCPCLIPLRERNLHENVSENYARYSLYFPGHGSHMVINETDIDSPWTSEFWLYRSTPQEILKVQVRNALLLLNGYEIAYLCEDNIKEKVLTLTKALKDDENKKPNEKMTRAERAAYQNEMMQRKLDMVNELTSLIPLYSDAVLSYLQAFQNFGICVESGIDAGKELKKIKFKGWDPQAPFSLETNYPGKPANSKVNINLNLTKEKSISNLSTVSQNTKDTNLSGHSSTETTDTIPKSNYEFLNLKESAILRHGKSYLSKYFQLAFNNMINIKLKALEELIKQREFELNPVKNADQANESHRDQSIDLSDSHEQILQTTLDTQIQEIETLKERINCASNEDRTQDIKFFSKMGDELAKFIGYTLLPDEKMSEFLCTWLEKPVTALKNFTFDFLTWKKLLEVIARLLKADFDKLQDWRIESGLLTPNISKSKKGLASKDSDDAQEKKNRKKEKEKQRRELKKLQSKASLDTNTEGEEASETLSTKEIKLIQRATELLKSGCGAEILADSNTVNSDGNRSRLCSSMYSGLSILFGIKDADTLTPLNANIDQDHHYDLLIPQNELAKLLKLDGQVGFLSASSKVSLIHDVLGTQPLFFPSKIPRGKWSHVAYVVTKEPNRIICYINGKHSGSIKDCYFALPMLSLGGSPYSLHSFSGIIIDARYWSHQRSGFQISEKFHKLLNLTPPELKIREGGPKSDLPSDSNSLPNQNIHSPYDDNGLIAWWTFDDGPLFNAVTDVTRNRFKSRLSNTLDFSLVTNSCFKLRYPLPTDLLAELPVEFTELILKYYSSNNSTQILENSQEDSDILMLSSNLLEESENFDKSISNNSTNNVLIINIFLRGISRWKWIEAESIRCYEFDFNNMIVTTDTKKSNKKSISTAKKESASQKQRALPTSRDSPSRVGTASRPNSKEKSSLVLPKPPPLPSYLFEERAFLQEERKKKSQNENMDSIDDDVDQSLPLSSFREQNFCLFELRRTRLAKSGRDLQRTEPCKLGCSELIKKMHMRFHVRYECPRRFVKCRFDFCNALFPCEEREEHEHTDCEAHLSSIHTLESMEESNQLIKCPDCSDQMRLRDLAHHRLDNCPYRYVFCPRDDCSFGKSPHFPTVKEPTPRIPFHLLGKHMSQECDSRSFLKRILFIEQSRSRHPYPRPWGIIIEENLDLISRDKTQEIVSNSDKINPV